MRAGLCAEFATQDELLAALAALRDRGYRALDAYSPYAVPGASEALHLARSPANFVAFALGLLGAGVAYLVQWYTAAVDYPLSVGGRPAHAPAAFVPIVFEMMVLAASLTTFFGLLLRLGLPRLHHPLFEVEGFERASIDRFFVAVDEADPSFEAARTRDELAALLPLSVSSFGETVR